MGPFRRGFFSANKKKKENSAAFKSEKKRKHRIQEKRKAPKMYVRALAGFTKEGGGKQA